MEAAPLPTLDPAQRRLIFRTVLETKQSRQMSKQGDDSDVKQYTGICLSLFLFLFTTFRQHAANGQARSGDPKSGQFLELV